ncbi:hypothetical protein EJ08DRAFT_247859 [Tothia fuscella]|uniref:Uncharacterized protein n=1 Tax=Tothia fuscella TaxID=1048955 RepID=A0A9P4TYW0_9PEZI|nr:hypothetical protein EJ08DRAFT_247859 [Tothia fuscella]
MPGDRLKMINLGCLHNCFLLSKDAWVRVPLSSIIFRSLLFAPYFSGGVYACTSLRASRAFHCSGFCNTENTSLGTNQRNIGTNLDLTSMQFREHNLRSGVKWYFRLAESYTPCVESFVGRITTRSILRAQIPKQKISLTESLTHSTGLLTWSEGVPSTAAYRRCGINPTVRATPLEGVK